MHKIVEPAQEEFDQTVEEICNNLGDALDLVIAVQSSPLLSEKQKREWADVRTYIEKALDEAASGAIYE